MSAYNSTDKTPSGHSPLELEIIGLRRTGPSSPSAMVAFVDMPHPGQHYKLDRPTTRVIDEIEKTLDHTVSLAIRKHRSMRMDEPTEVYFGRIQRKALEFRLLHVDGRPYRGMTVHFVDDADYCEVGTRFVA